MADAKYIEKPTERPKSINKLDNSAVEALSKKLSAAHRADRSLLLERGILKDNARISSSLVQAQMSLLKRKTGDELNNFLSNRKTMDELVKKNVLKDGAGVHGRITAGQGELKKKQTEDILSRMYANRPTLSELMRKSIVIDIGESMDPNSPNSPKVLGRADRLETLYSPVKVEGPDGIKFNDVSCGYSFSVLVGTNGKMYSWGKGENGRTGQGSVKSIPYPNPISTVEEPVTHVSCADGHSICVTKSGATYSWGWGWNFRLGHNDNADVLVPQRIEALNGVKVKAISAGAYQSCFVSEEGKLYTCGWGKNGRLGHGSETDKSTPVPVPLPSSVSVTAIKAGSNHVLFSASNGTLWGFGRNDYGQLGLGNRTNQLSPVEITSVPKGCTSFGCGWSSSAVVCADGSLLAFGKGEAGQLGNNKLENTDTPVKPVLPAGKQAVEVRFTSNAMVVRTKDGDVLTVGRGHLGELGLGNDRKFVGTLTAIPELKGKVTILDTGVAHCICVTKDDELFVWGEGKSCFTGEDAVRSSSLELTPAEDLDEIAEGEEEED